MGVIHVIDQGGGRHTLEAVEGWRVMEIATGTCRSKAPAAACECATCHVFVAPEWAGKLFPPSEEEEGKLDMVPLTEPNSRLACQILFGPELDGLEVTLAPVSG